MMQEKRMQKAGLCLLGMSVLILVMVMLNNARGVKMLEHYGSASMFLFAGMVLLSGRWHRHADLLIGAVLVGWFVLSRMLMGELYLEYSWLYLANMMCAYTLALPYALVMDDGEQFRGLRLTAWIFFLCFAAMAWLGTAAVVMEKQIVLPVLGTDFGLGTDHTSVDYRRLRLGNVGNISAAMALVAMLLGGWLLADRFSARRAALFSLPFLGLYTAVAFTGSRTVMLQFSFWMAGVTVMLMKSRLTLGKKVLACAAAGAAVFAAVFLGFGMLAAAAQNLDGLLAKAAAEELKVMQRPIGKDLVSMTGRTDIYRAVFQLIGDQPEILLTGQLHSKMVQNLHLYHEAPHAHNSYLQILLNLGIPGLLTALWFTGRTVWTAFRVFFSYAGRASSREKLLALTAVTMLISAIPESFLFSEFMTLYNFTFFLIFGYLIAAEKRLRIRA